MKNCKFNCHCDCDNEFLDLNGVEHLLQSIKGYVDENKGASEEQLEAIKRYVDESKSSSEEKIEIVQDMIELVKSSTVSLDGATLNDNANITIGTTVLDKTGLTMSNVESSIKIDDIMLGYSELKTLLGLLDSVVKTQGIRIYDVDNSIEIGHIDSTSGNRANPDIEIANTTSNGDVNIVTSSEGSVHVNTSGFNVNAENKIELNCEGSFEANTANFSALANDGKFEIKNGRTKLTTDELWVKSDRYGDILQLDVAKKKIRHNANSSLTLTDTEAKIVAPNLTWIEKKQDGDSIVDVNHNIGDTIDTVDKISKMYPINDIEALLGNKVNALLVAGHTAETISKAISYCIMNNKYVYNLDLTCDGQITVTDSVWANNIFKGGSSKYKVAALKGMGFFDTESTSKAISNIVLNNGKYNPLFDFNGDGSVTGGDVVDMVSAYNSYEGPESLF